jgi:hypothetical protein
MTVTVKTCEAGAGPTTKTFFSCAVQMTMGHYIGSIIRQLTRPSLVRVT